MVVFDNLIFANLSIFLFLGINLKNVILNSKQHVGIKIFITALFTMSKKLDPIWIYHNKKIIKCIHALDDF